MGPMYKSVYYRHLVGNCQVTTWEDTGYPLHTGIA